MRLKRIEAVRFGRIDGRSLGDFSDKLTVVLGPNEAGKSSFTALVRHVLYGFPTPADAKESPYLSSAGDREGRLIFADGDQEWIVQRSHGTRGGTVTTIGTDGTRRDGLVSELTAGVGRNAYRVALGFGLADLAQLDELKGKDEDLIARLYAAGAGIGGNLMDARKSIQGGMESLWKKGGSTPDLNRARAERDKLRAEARRLESESESLREQAARLEKAIAELEAAKARRAETQAVADRIGRALAEAGKLRESAQEASAEAERLAREAAAATEDAAAVQTDPAGMAAADEVDALVEELSGFRGQLDSLAAAQTRLDTIGGKLRTALTNTGWTEDRACMAAADAGVGAELEAFRDRLSKARGRVEAAAAALDGARVADASDGAAVAETGRPWLVPGVAVAIIGAVAIAAGLATGQSFLAIFGALVAVAGAGFALVTRRGGSPAGSRGARSAGAEVEYRAATDALAAVAAEWGAWATAHGLGDASDDPAAVAARYLAARTVAELAADREEAVSAGTRARDAAETFTRRVAVVCAPLSGEEAAAVTLERTAEFVNRARARVAAARVSARQASELAERANALSRDALEATRRAEDLHGRAVASLTAACAGADEEAARAAEHGARNDAAEAAAAYDRLAEEVTELRTRIGSDRRETALAEVRLQEETLTQQIAEGAREYIELALASRLLTRAQERYERDRQPAVVRNAEAAFVRMTSGRYSRVAVPLGRESIEVFDRAGAAHTATKLSRGTAEQLYLALRIGLIDQLGAAGASLPVLMDDVLVNFSPERAKEAACAIADLSERRQVIFFTCHPATAELLCEVAPAAVRLTIEPTP